MQIHFAASIRKTKTLPIAICVAAAIGLGIFSYLASTVTNFPGEVTVSTTVQSLQADWLDPLMEAMSVPGLLVVAVPMVILTSVWLYLKGWKAESLMFLVASVFGRVVAILVKEIVDRPRPSGALVEIFQASDTPSFPSGHVTYYTVFLGVFLFILMVKVKPGIALNIVQVIVLLALVAVGISRIYLGVHWLGDVLAGYAFGTAVVALAAWLWRIRSRELPS